MGMISPELWNLSIELEMILNDVIQQNNSNREPDIVMRYLQEVGNKFPRPLPIGRYLVEINTSFIHQHPYAMFSIPRPCNASRVEPGDILFVVKHKNQFGRIQEKRVSFVQVKISKNPNEFSWDIQYHQQEFALNHRKYQFHFGNQTSKKAGIPPKTTFTLTSKSKWLFSYLLMSMRKMHFSVSPTFVEIYRPVHCPTTKGTPFKFYFFGRYPLTPESLSVRINNEFVGSWYPIWAYKFLQRNGIGAHAETGDLKDLVDALYRLVGLLPDPPEEFEGYTEEGTFGIIEFTIQEKEGIR